MDHESLTQTRSARSLLVALIAACGLFPSWSHAARIHDSFPDVVNAQDRYVIYSHGLIVEGTDPKPVHPEFGIYDFPAIKSAIFQDGGFHLIAHHRPKGTDVRAYVDTLESWVRKLVDAGVAPDRITLVGFSRGAQLTAYASSRLRSLGIGTVLMGVCSNGDLRGTPPVILGGRVLSIFETTDVVTSCSGLAERSRPVSFEEIAITTGRKHGAFYRPLPEWIDPLKRWIAATNPAKSSSTGEGR